MHPDVFSQLHALVGAGVVAYEVSQVQDSVRSMLEVADHSLKGLDVGMDIRKNRHPHDHSLQSASDTLNQCFNCSGTNNYHKKYVHRRKAIDKNSIDIQRRRIEK
jgi:hypothetical protein